MILVRGMVCRENLQRPLISGLHETLRTEFWKDGILPSDEARSFTSESGWKPDFLS